jgi:uncharacterized protein YdbL (DUF1318 family)
MMTHRTSLRFILIPVLLALLSTLGISSSAFAASLQQSKSQGLIGEQPNGYLGLVKSNAPADVKRLMNEINAKRRQAYLDIARRNNTSVDVVEKLAGKKAIERTPAGQYVRLPSGNWVRK